MSEEIECAKLNLSSGKVVLIRTPQIGHLEKAEKAAGGMQGFGFIKELVKMLIVEIDGVKKKPIELENLDNVLSIKDFMQISSVVGNFIGEDVAIPQPEMIFGTR